MKNENTISELKAIQGFLQMQRQSGSSTLSAYTVRNNDAYLLVPYKHCENNFASDVRQSILAIGELNHSYQRKPLVIANYMLQHVVDESLSAISAMENETERAINSLSDLKAKISNALNKRVKECPKNKHHHRKINDKILKKKFLQARQTLTEIKHILDPRYSKEFLQELTRK